MANNNSDTVTVVCASDDNYAMPLSVTACSILKNLPSDQNLNLYVLDGGIQTKNLDKIRRSLDSSRCKLTFFNTKDRFKEVPTTDHFTEAIFHRLLIPELLPTNLQKVIYLDCDLLVLTDISELWNIEIGDYHLLAVQDFLITTISKGVVGYQDLQIPATNKYFNSGVLVFNLHKWREDNTSSKVIEYVTKPRNYKIFGDQEALNAVLWDKWGELYPKWNRQFKSSSLEDQVLINSLEEIYGEASSEDIVNNPHIIHFIQDTKPWQYYKHPRKNLFYEYLDLTDWKGWRYTVWKVMWKKIIKTFAKQNRKKYD